MDDTIWLALAGVFSFFILVDLIGHRKLRLRRGAGQWLLLLVLLAVAVFSGQKGIRDNWNGREKEDCRLYLAYCYLLDGKGSQAEAKEALCTGGKKEHREMVRLLAECVNGDCAAAYFHATRLIQENMVGEELLPMAESIREMMGQELGLFSGETSDSRTLDERIRIEAQKCFALLGTDPQEDEKYQALYEADARILSGAAEEISEEEMETLVSRYHADEDILRLAVQYASSTGRMGLAESWAGELAKSYRSAQNDVIYTDVIAQAALTADESTIAQDPEAGELIEEAEELERQASRKDGEEQDELLIKAEELRKEARAIPIERAMNYLDARKPLFYDKEGIYSVQKAKLYLAAGKREEARDAIYEILEDGPNLSGDSPMKEPLLAVIHAYQQSTSDSPSPLLRSSVYGLVETESQGVVPMGEDTVNGQLAGYMTSTLKYDKLGIHIGKIDTTSYPEITAYVNINGSKDQKSELVSGLSQRDFELIDTQFGITEFTMEEEGGNEETNIAIVIDRSGSMDGTPLENAKTAAVSCVENLPQVRQKMALVTYDDTAQISVPLTGSISSLKRGIDELASGGGTDISGGVRAGIEALAKAEGGKAMILLSDGQDNNSVEAMQEAVDEAKAQQIVIYTVGFGDADGDYLSSIAESTGGKCILADSAMELEDIYRNLQKYIVNNYRFHYTVSQNPEEDPRNLTVLVSEYGVSGDRDYTIGGGILEESERTASIAKGDGNSLTAAAVVPGGISASEAARGVRIKVEGSGFVEGMTAGLANLALTEIQVESPTTLTATLKGTLEAGSYSLRLTLPDGRTAVKTDALAIFRAGTARTVRIGGNTITADSIGQTGDNQFVAAGNVMLNGFIHTNESMHIKADALPEGFSFGGSEISLGDSGYLTGSGKLFISYQQAKANGTGSAAFANLVMGGKDYVVEDGDYSFRVEKDTSELELSARDRSLAIDIPQITKVEIAELEAYANQLRLTVHTIDLSELKDQITEGLTGKKNTSAAEKKARDAAKKITKRGDAQKFKGFEGSVSVILDAKDIHLAADVKMNANDAFSFGNVGLGSISLKIDTKDPEHEYWKFGGSVDLGKMISTLGQAANGFEGSISSYYWFPDSFTVKMNLAGELTPNVYNIVFLKSLGLEAEGMSTFFLKSSAIPDAAKAVIFGENFAEIEPKEIVLAGTAAADVNLFKSLHINIPQLQDWGEIGEISGKAGVNFSIPELFLKADLKLLGHKLANAALSAGKKGVKAEAGAEMEVSLLDCSIGGDVDFGISANTVRIEGTFGISGHLDCGWLKIHHQGEAKLTQQAQWDGKYASVEALLNNRDSYKWWYEDGGQILFWNRFHSAYTRVDL